MGSSELPQGTKSRPYPIFGYKPIPKLLKADAYTIGSGAFESQKAKEKSVYYITARKKPSSSNPDLYEAGDDRMVLVGHTEIIEELFYQPVTQWDIEEAKRFLAFSRVDSNGQLTNYDFPEELWQLIVDKYCGYIPIKIIALPEGSVFYPNEPIMEIGSETLTDEQVGYIAAWFESSLLKIWATSERVTQNEHLFKYFKKVVLESEPDLPNETVELFASIMITDFGDRAAITNQETERLGMYHLLTFSGTDSFAAAYKAYKWSYVQQPDPKHQASSVKALAHRNPQSFETEKECYETMYNNSPNDSILSMVNDVYDSKRANREYIAPLAVRSNNEKNGKVIVSRQDSGDAFTGILDIINNAIENGLFTTHRNKNGAWFHGTFLKFLAGDGLNFKTLKELIRKLLDEKIAVHRFGLFGMGGGFRNGLKRDNFSWKYAICAVGKDLEGVVKFSNDFGKTTLPGPFKVLRSEEALATKRTVVHYTEEGSDARILFYNGASEDPFDGIPFGGTKFADIKRHLRNQMNTMPYSMESETNHNFPISQKLIDMRLELLKKYAPSKNIDDFK